MFNGKSQFDSLGYKKYVELSDADIHERYDVIINLWRAFLTQNAPTLELNVDYFVHQKNLFEVIRRCDERNLYYYIFHDLEDICEYKDIALYCFWINTLKPFMVVNPDALIYNGPNELFSLFLILTVIIPSRFNKSFKTIFISFSLIYESIYSLLDFILL